MTARTKPTTAEQALRALEREALEDADRNTAEMRAGTGRAVTCSGHAYKRLPDGTTLWVTADRSVLKSRRKFQPGDVQVGHNLAYVPGYNYWLDNGDHEYGVYRPQVLALLEGETVEMRDE